MSIKRGYKQKGAPLTRGEWAMLNGLKRHAHPTYFDKKETGQPRAVDQTAEAKKQSVSKRGVDG